MSKRTRILVKESALTDFFKSFFKAKAANKESEWLKALRKQDPKLGDIWAQYDKDITDSMRWQRDMLTKLNLDTSKVDAIIKSRGLKV